MRRGEVDHLFLPHTELWEKLDHIVVRVQGMPATIWDSIDFHRQHEVENKTKTRKVITYLYPRLRPVCTIESLFSKGSSSCSFREYNTRFQIAKILKYHGEIKHW